MSLSRDYPELAKQAYGWDPSEITKGSSKRLSWKCSKGHIWDAIVSNRANLGSGCPYCAGQRVIAGENDLSTVNPQLASEAYGWDPSTEMGGTAHKRDWICGLGHIWTATVLSRSQGNGCPFCANQKVLPGFNDLVTSNPNLAAEAYGWDPSTVVSKSHAKYEWQCGQGHVWTAAISNRSNGTGCPVCSGKNVIAGFNDLASQVPVIAAEADGWDPTTVTKGSHQILNWKCSLGHKWRARVSSREENGCPFCGNKKVLEGFNDLQTVNPVLSKEAFGWDPAEFLPGSPIKKKWKCNEGHIWTATISSRNGLGRGCPTCSIFGYDPNKDGWLYFLEHDEWKMYQIGITNHLEQRLKKHKSIGWEVIEVRGPMDGFLAREIESSILQFLQSQGARLGAEAGKGRFDGYTEAWDKDSFAVAKLKNLIDLANK